jgi:uncharacterized DUF497 family protein
LVTTTSASGRRARSELVYPRGRRCLIRRWMYSKNRYSSRRSSSSRQLPQPYTETGHGNPRIVANPQRIYVAIQYGTVASGIEFDWDDENKKHLDAHKVAPTEFEQLLNNDPVDLNFELIDNEERYRSVGLTNGGRLLSVAWTIRNGKVRAITAFPASVSDRKAFLERPK